MHKKKRNRDKKTQFHELKPRIFYILISSQTEKKKKKEIIYEIVKKNNEEKKEEKKKKEEKSINLRDGIPFTVVHDDICKIS